jgi:hypothetical protein
VQSPSMAGSRGSDLRSGETMFPATQAGARHARDAPGDRGRSHSCLPGMGPLWEGEHGVHGTGSTPPSVMGEPRWLVAAGPPLSRLHSCWPTWSGGERLIMLCGLTNHCEERMCSRASEGANCWHHALGSERRLWLLAEPLDAGRRARCSRAPCRPFPLERHSSQKWVLSHVAGRWVKIPSEELGGSLLPG